MKSTRQYHNFSLCLEQLTVILEPMACSIKCLEGLKMSIGDVWKFYVAITAVLADMFQENRC